MPKKSSKSKSKKERIEEITFDPKARIDYITGFRKRKLEKQKKREKKRTEMEKEEKRQTKRQARQKIASVQKEIDRIEAIRHGNTAAVDDTITIMNNDQTEMTTVTVTALDSE